MDSAVAEAKTADRDQKYVVPNCGWRPGNLSHSTSATTPVTMHTLPRATREKPDPRQEDWISEGTLDAQDALFL